MASDPLAPVSLLAEWLGEPISEEADVQRATWLLRRASTLVLETANRLANPWTAANVPDGVQQIVLSCASRAYTNPESWNYERLDDWMGGGRPVPEDGLYLTATEKRSLEEYAVTSTRGVGILQTGREVWPPATSGFVDDTWVQYINGTDPRP